MKLQNLIYGLKDPRNDVYFYIGKTSVSLRRPLSHLVKSHNIEVNNLVNEINLEGLEVIVDIIEKGVELNNLIEREKYWICFYSKNNELLNKNNFLSERNRVILSVNDIEEDVLDNLLSGVEEIGNTVKKFRLKRNISQEKLAFLSGIARTTLSSIENKTNTASLDSILKILKALKEYKKESVGFNKVRYV